MSRRPNPTRQIELRQRSEDHVAKYMGVAVDHAKARLRSQWEHSTDKKIQTTQLVRSMDVAQARHDEILMARRLRLTELLKTEREEHEQMLAGLVVTDDQRRERLMQQARDLRVERERLRKAEAERRKDQLFREQSVLVREAESHIKVLHVAAERAAQLETTLQRKKREADEERFWEEQQMEAQRQQAQRAQQDLQKLHGRAREISQNLALQVDRNQKRKQEEMARTQSEDSAFVADVKAGIARDAQAEAARRDRQRQIAAETKEMNEELNKKKAETHALLREEEKRELDELLHQIALDEERERERARNAREEAARQMKYVEAQMNAAAESENALDRLWQQESDAQWAKREAQWAREAQRRQETLRKVYEARRDQIYDIRRREMEELEKRRKEHDALVAAGTQMGQEDAEAAAKRRHAAVVTRQYQEHQIAQKAAAAEAERNAKRNELTTAQAVEKLYETKIREELGKIDDSRPDGFRHVKLGSRRRPM